MDTNSRPPTAKIYQFPRSSSANRARSAQRIAAAPDPQSFPSVEFGSGWYHEAAVQADLPRKP
jgi:Protein of unknown function (DUF2735)